MHPQISIAAAITAALEEDAVIAAINEMNAMIEMERKKLRSGPEFKRKGPADLMGAMAHVCLVLRSKFPETFSRAVQNMINKLDEVAENDPELSVCKLIRLIHDDTKPLTDDAVEDAWSSYLVGPIAMASFLALPEPLEMMDC